jgi:hypothetical protein
VPDLLQLASSVQPLGSLNLPELLQPRPALNQHIGTL